MALREETLGRLLTRIRDGDAEAHRLETRIELYLEQREALETAAETRKEEGNALQAELTAAAESLERARGEAERQNHTVRETEQELSRRQSELRETRSGQTAREESIEAEKSRVHELAGRFTRAEIQIQSFQDQLSSLDRRKAQVDAERARDRQRQKETQSRLESAERRSEEASAALEDVRAREAALRGELEEKTAGLARTQEAMYRLKEDLASQSSSLTALEGLARSMDGSGWKGWPGEILSPLADLMEVQPGYEIAIEAVLGERLQGAVVEGPSEVRDAVEHLRKSGAGRGALIPKGPPGSAGRRVIPPGLLRRVLPAVRRPAAQRRRNLGECGRLRPGAGRVRFPRPEVVGRRSGGPGFRRGDLPVETGAGRSACW